METVPADLEVAVTGEGGPLRRQVAAALAGAGIEVAESPERADLHVLCLPAPGRGSLSELIPAADQRRVAVVPEPISGKQAKALAARCEGVVLASRVESALVPAVLAVHTGQCVLPRALSRLANPKALSAREKQVLGMVVLGLSNAEIASKLVVSESTVKAHLRSSFGKLGVSSRSAATELLLDPSTGLGLGVLRISSPDEPE
jgi:DNA-binding NarL/FixJ family response regulator